MSDAALFFQKVLHKSEGRRLRAKYRLLERVVSLAFIQPWAFSTRRKIKGAFIYLQTFLLYRTFALHSQKKRYFLLPCHKILNSKTNSRIYSILIGIVRQTPSIHLCLSHIIIIKSI